MPRCTRYDNELAQSVFSKLKHLCSDEEIAKMSFDRYKNGREQGFFLQANNKKVAFAEFRRSDDIVVYFAHFAKWPADGTLSDEIYFGGRKIFYADHVGDAAKFIRNYLFT